MDVRDAAAKYRIEPVIAADADDVPPGYKRTEVGVIPEGWRLASLLSLAGGTKERFDDGDWIEAEFLTDDGIRLIQTGNIGVGCFVDKEARKHISPESFDKLRCKDVLEGDLLVCRLAEPAGRACIVPKLEEGRAITAVDVTIFRPVQRIASKRFLLQYFSTKQWFSQVDERCGGSTRSRIARGALGRIEIPLPPTVAEQEAIAEALSDADALIESLQQLIAKRRAIKQGAMQALLTGRQRLPGFSGRWQTKRLGDVAHIKTGGRNNQDKVENGAYPFFVRSELVERINSFSYDCEAVLVPGEGRIGEIFHYINGRFDVHQRVYAITQFAPDVSGRYIHLYMSVHFGAHAMENSVKATVDSLRLPTFHDFEINFPPTVEEQTAIAAVLSDMDAAIDALEARLAKTRALKAGMMQQLLTGRIRLPLDRAA